MLYRALKMWFWLTYDHLGRLLIFNFVCALPIALLLGLGMTLSGPLGLLLTFLAFAVAAPAAIAALGSVARELLERNEAPYPILLDGLRRFGPSGALVGTIGGVVVITSGVGVYFYLAVVAQPTPWYAYALAGVCAWVGTFATLVLAFALVAIPQKRAGARSAVTTGALLVANNPIFCFVVALHLAGLATCAMAMPVFLLFSVAPMATLLTTAYEMLARKYAAPIVNGKHVIDFKDDEDDYLNRGLRDFFFPWKQ